MSAKPSKLPALKHCPRCGLDKPRHQFYAHPTTADRLGTWCGACCRRYQRAKYQERIRRQRKR